MSPRLPRIKTIGCIAKPTAGATRLAMAKLADEIFKSGFEEIVF